MKAPHLDIANDPINKPAGGTGFAAANFRSLVGENNRTT